MITDKQTNAYNDYLVKHIQAVNKCFNLLTGGVIRPEHDYSKWSSAEYEPYADYFYDEDGNRRTEHTPEQEEAFNKAWLHHIHRNPHHWQHWVLVQDDGPTLEIEMPMRYVYEMIADWGAFALIKKNPNDIIDFWNKQKNRYRFHPETRKQVERLIPVMAERIAEELSKKEARA